MSSFLKVEDAGLYTCLASSLAGEDGKNHWIRVQGDTSCFLHIVQNISRLSLSVLFTLPLTCTWDLMNKSMCTLRE